MSSDAGGVSEVKGERDEKITFCERVTVSEYEHQKLSSSQGALQELLDGIVRNKDMTLKDKKKHLKHVSSEMTSGCCRVSRVGISQHNDAT